MGYSSDLCDGILLSTKSAAPQRELIRLKVELPLSGQAERYALCRVHHSDQAPPPPSPPTSHPAQLGQTQDQYQNSQPLTGGYSRLWHRARGCCTGGPVRIPYAKVDCESGTTNLATGSHVCRISNNYYNFTANLVRIMYVLSLSAESSSFLTKSQPVL